MVWRYFLTQYEEIIGVYNVGEGSFPFKYKEALVRNEIQMEENTSYIFAVKISV